ncbi:MAG: hypothetical protein HXY20_13720 [Acidobacteria bacterium]|nr:hypothetical protein [Acidobacteriota bacterium]
MSLQRPSRLLIAAALTLLAPVASSQEPEIPYAGEVPLVPNVRPVIVVSGTYYEMGYQHSQQLIQIFGTYYLKGASEVKRSAEELGGLKQVDALVRKHTPELVEYVRGMAAGASAAGIPMTYEQMLAQFATTENGPSGGREEEDCSGWAAWGSATKDGKLIAGGSGDHQIRVGSKYRYRYEVVLVCFPKTGNNFLLCPPSGGAGHPGMNNKGVVYVHHGATGYCGRASGAETGEKGVPRPFMVLHALRFANSALDAQNIVLSLPNPDGRQGGLWADVNGNALDIENRDNPRLIRRPGDNGEKDFIYATNNLFSKELGSCYKPPAGQKLAFVPHAGWLGTQGSRESIPRNLGMWNLFANYYGKVDLEFAKMMWRFSGDPPYYDTIEEAVADFDKSQGRRWNGKISETGNSVVAILQPDNGDKGVVHVSQGCASRISEPHWTGLLLYRIAPTYTFFELNLGATPRATAEQARRRAMFDMYYGNKELRKLTYRDAAYAPLDELFNKAATEWQKGEFYVDAARKTAGNESVGHWAKAIRCYTRCQAYAKQVRESLVPPPARPEDLGLPKWLGEWGKWATREGTDVTEFP